MHEFPYINIAWANDAIYRLTYTQRSLWSHHFPIFFYVFPHVSRITKVRLFGECSDSPVFILTNLSTFDPGRLFNHSLNEILKFIKVKTNMSMLVLLNKKMIWWWWLRLRSVFICYFGLILSWALTTSFLRLEFW